MLAGGALDGTKWVSPVGVTIRSRDSRRTLVLKPMNFQSFGWKHFQSPAWFKSPEVLSSAFTDSRDEEAAHQMLMTALPC